MQISNMRTLTTGGFILIGILTVSLIMMGVENVNLKHQVEQQNEEIDSNMIYYNDVVGENIALTDKNKVLTDTIKVLIDNRDPDGELAQCQEAAKMAVDMYNDLRRR